MAEGLRNLLLLFVPLFVAGLCMVPFFIPLFDAMAKRDLAAIQARRAAEGLPNGDAADGDNPPSLIQPAARGTRSVASQRFESSVTAISWIPSEAITGPSKVPFGMGITHYDDPPPDQIEDLEALRVSDKFREANELRAFIEVEDGRIVSAGHLGQGHIGATTVRVGPAAMRFPAVHLPDIQQEPEIGETSARFVQTVGGRMGLPTPRPIPHKPFVQFWPSIAWTTLALTINADGTSSHEVVGASPFPRHWIYDDNGTLVEKSATIDFGKWFNHSFGDRTPWGEQDSPAVVAAVESALERSLVRRDHARRREARDQDAEGRRHARPPGRGRHRGLPHPRRDVRRRGRREGDRRDRPGRGGGGAGVAPERDADRDALGARRPPASPPCRPTRSIRRRSARSTRPIAARSSARVGARRPVVARVTSGATSCSVGVAGVEEELPAPRHGTATAWGATSSRPRS